MKVRMRVERAGLKIDIRGDRGDKTECWVTLDVFVK